MQRYEKYKDSGVKYIGEIPKDWQIVKGKRLLKEEKRAVRKQDEIVTCFRDGQVTLRRLRKTEGFTNSLKEIGYQGIRKGDLVIHNMDAFAGAIGIAENDGKSTPVYSVCTEKISGTLHLEFYSYYLRNLAVRGLILSLAKGIRERSTDFRFSDLGSLELPVPSLEEQQTIAIFLDDKTSKIDQTIANKQKEIELLKERRQILIQKAVTKGLDDTVKLKDSGVDWIGGIPEHWEVIPNKYIFRQKKVLVGKKSADYDLLSLTLRGIIKRDMENPEGKFPAEFDTYQEVKKGDFVFCLFDVEETPRTVGLSNFDGMITGAYTVMTVNSIINKKFLYYYYLSLDEKKKLKYLYKGLRNTIPKDSFFSLKTILPSDEEQSQIVSYLEEIEEKISKATLLKQQEIEKLKEYKTVLIDNVVTGKVKINL
ncbi:restriction endonuclease subunit S [Myroides marinus]|uniref:restriction endonuclease subunit S n=1 Tax=Myroides marinus TaxID=703342 RepID=UPI002576436B|nr:restriction endonuclease subunit S [Myroides marinus]MDM1350693.1 restriction endonuclease subunit S [Myroides marinus]MDM1357900.1 restriction endonuclease subunit S [Myroides marinus]MDM1365978.1 restriction endonuclease subunit S [Myroides marinus]